MALRSRTQQLNTLEQQEKQLSLIGTAEGYHKTFQGKIMNELISSGPRQITIEDLLLGEQVGRVSNNGVALEIFGESLGLSAVTPQELKAFTLYTHILTKQLPSKDQFTIEKLQECLTVTLTLDEYMKACGLSDRKNARKNLNQATLSLYNLSLEGDEERLEPPEGKKRPVKTKRHFKFRIADATITSKDKSPVVNGKVTFVFSLPFAHYLIGAYIAYIPDALYKINCQKRPYSFQMGWKLSINTNINIRKHPDRAYCISVKSMLAFLGGLPSYEEIKNSGNIYNRIIKPFDENMMELKSKELGILADYYYYYPEAPKKKIKLTSLTYKQFEELYIHYDFLNYPLLQAKEEEYQIDNMEEYPDDD